MSRRVLCLALAAVLAALGLASMGPRVDAPGHGPNVILILTDDMRLDDMKYMPYTQHLLADQGVTFSQMLSPYPLCCPARAEILSGQYSHNNGVEGNAWPRGGYYRLDSTNTLPVWLSANGYETAFMGKYLNEYGDRDKYEVPPGWDNWSGSTAGIYNYSNVTENVQGQTISYHNVYQTDLYDRRAQQLIRLYQHSDRPYFMWVSFVTPHAACSRSNAEESQAKHGCWHSSPPELRDRGSLANLPINDNASINEQDMTDKGRFMQRLPLITPGRLAILHKTRIRRIEALQAVDRSVAHLVARLKATGEYPNTYLVFTSDNGFQLGEHRWQSKILGYEPSVRVPLIISGPGLPHGVVRNTAVTTVDLAATIDDLTNTQPQRLLDGTSLLPLARGSVPDNRDRMVPLEAGRLDNKSPGWLYRGIRTNRYTLLIWHDGDVELYDRWNDPLEDNSVAGQPAYARVQHYLTTQLNRMHGCAGPTCLRYYHPPRPQ